MSCHDFMYDVAAMPIAPNANAMSRAAGRIRAAYQDPVRPRTTITARNQVAYRPPRRGGPANPPTEHDVATPGIQPGWQHAQQRRPLRRGRLASDLGGSHFVSLAVNLRRATRTPATSRTSR